MINVRFRIAPRSNNTYRSHAPVLGLAAGALEPERDKLDHAHPVGLVKWNGLCDLSPAPVYTPTAVSTSPRTRPDSKYAPKLQVPKTQYS